MRQISSFKEPTKSYFGVTVHNGQYVDEEEIARLPFYDFWRESAKGSTCVVEDGKTYINLYDWEQFCTLFIKTGKHRYQP